MAGVAMTGLDWIDLFTLGWKLWDRGFEGVSIVPDLTGSNVCCMQYILIVALHRRGVFVAIAPISVVSFLSRSSVVVKDRRNAAPLLRRKG